MKLLFAIVILISIIQFAAYADDENVLSKLVIGVKKRIQPCPTRKSRDGDRLSMHYVGKLLEDGSKFDSSRDRDQPFEFVLGTGQVIQGWEQGLRDMCPGEIRKLKIPYNLAYGEKGMPPTIPAKAALVFEVELLEIVNLNEDQEL